MMYTKGNPTSKRTLIVSLHPFKNQPFQLCNKINSPLKTLFAYICLLKKITMIVELKPLVSMTKEIQMNHDRKQQRKCIISNMLHLSILQNKKKRGGPHFPLTPPTPARPEQYNGYRAIRPCCAARRRGGGKGSGTLPFRRKRTEVKTSPSDPEHSFRNGRRRRKKPGGRTLRGKGKVQSPVRCRFCRGRRERRDRDRGDRIRR